MGGIYAITNSVNGAVYVGKTKKRFKNRWIEHKFMMRLGIHTNWFLSRDYEIFGEDVFSYSVLEEIPGDAPLRYYLERENHWISEVEKTTFCYSNCGATAVESKRKRSPSLLVEAIGGKMPTRTKTSQKVIKFRKLNEKYPNL